MAELKESMRKLELGDMKAGTPVQTGLRSEKKQEAPGNWSAESSKVTRSSATSGVRPKQVLRAEPLVKETVWHQTATRLAEFPGISMESSKRALRVPTGRELQTRCF